MTDHPQDGGPAFPATVQGWNDRLSQSQGGMSLRDWFAGQALAGMMASAYVADHAGTNKTDAEFVGGLAARSYVFADAMLAERVKHADATR